MIRPYVIKRTDAKTCSVRFSGPDGRAIKLGVRTEQEADALSRKIQLLQSAVLNDEPLGAEVDSWLSKIPQTWVEKLTAAKLLEGVRAARMEALDDHFAQWASTMRTQSEGRSLDGIRILRAWARRCQWTSLQQINLAQVEQEMGAMLDGDQETDRKPMKPTTVKKHAQILQQFCAWCVRVGKLRVSPLAELEHVSGGVERERKALDLDEQRWFLAVTATGPMMEWGDKAGNVLVANTGAERALVYLLVLETGFRAGELKSLLRSSFALSRAIGGKAAPVVYCGKTKNGKPAAFALRAPMAEQLAAHLGTKAPSAPAFSLPRGDKMAAMIRADLARARDAWINGTTDPDERQRRAESHFCADIDEVGGVFDFHALRVTFITNMGRAGVPLQQAVKLARHSDPKLTIGIYTKLGVVDQDEALARLPDLMAREPKTLAATGTTGPLGHMWDMGASGKGADACGSGVPALPLEAPEPLRFPAVSSASDRDLPGSGGDETRTHDLLHAMETLYQGAANGEIPEENRQDDKTGTWTPADPDLAAVVEAWPRLPAAVKAGILAMVRS